MFILVGREPWWKLPSCIPQYLWSVSVLLQGASADLILPEGWECIDEVMFHIGVELLEKFTRKGVNYAWF